MHIVGLVSGGKDSCYALMQCIAAGHEVVALATLLPAPGIEESDSHMYQSVGVRGIDTIAKAMGGVPLFTRTITGSSINTSADYSEPLHDDEVEDLYHLLQQVKDNVAGGVDGVSVGAILSDYQRVRVEHVCARLNLTSVAYLWRRDQTELMREMVDCGLEAVLVKVAGAGLQPSRHCGLTLRQMMPTLEGLHSKFGLHICGEGGEFESFTLDCPLYEKRIKITERSLVEEPGDVGYLVLHKLQLEDKERPPERNTTSRSRVLAARVPTPDRFVRDVTHPDGGDTATVDTCCGTCVTTSRDDAANCSRVDAEQRLFMHRLTANLSLNAEDMKKDNKTINGRGVCVSASGWWAAWGWAGEDVHALLDELEAELCGRGVSLSSACEVRAFVRCLGQYADFNAQYRRHFGYNPPVRACVQVPGTRACQLEVLGHCPPSSSPAGDGTSPRSSPAGDGTSPRSTLHVQSVSHWAPANIGPYSQAVSVDGCVLLAGMLGLVPGTMEVVEGGAGVEASLAVRHLHRVVAAVTEKRGGSADLVQLVCYSTSTAAATAAATALPPRITLHVVVQRLPKDASVELHAWAAGNGTGVQHHHTTTTTTTTTTVEGFHLHQQHVLLSSARAAHVAKLGNPVEDDMKITRVVICGVLSAVICKLLPNGDLLSEAADATKAATTLSDDDDPSQDSVAPQTSSYACLVNVTVYYCPCAVEEQDVMCSLHAIRRATDETSTVSVTAVPVDAIPTPDTGGSSSLAVIANKFTSNSQLPLETK